MKVRRKTLLIVAGFVWFFAGLNIMKIGAEASRGQWSWLMLGLAALTFALFHNVVFRRMVRKHTRRITSYQEERMSVFRFFDRAAYLIMTVMIAAGVSLRAFHWWPDVCIATFYSGLGLSLVVAGLSFLLQYRRYCKAMTVRA